jgi:hypothetical protein
MRSLVFALLVLAAIRAEASPDGSAPVEVFPLEPNASVPSEPPPIVADTETGLWMQLQSSGRVAGPRYTFPGKVATQIYQRYLNSFTHKIPEQFDFKRSSVSRSGSGTGSGR